MILKTFKMSGVVLADKDVVYGMDENIVGESPIIPVSIRKTDGEFGAASSALSLKTFDKLRKVADAKAAEIGNAILAGDINSFPYQKGQRTGCSYCPYGAVCALEATERKNKYNVVQPAAAVLFNDNEKRR
jgi:ATP-dependent helicase/nuclease subunit B